MFPPTLAVRGNVREVHGLPDSRRRNGKTFFFGRGGHTPDRVVPGVVADAEAAPVHRDQPPGFRIEAGLHRLLACTDELKSARVVVAVAGMEGALASVVGGLVSCPVIAVPTSVGYGASFGGISALLSMLNSCAAGVSVVNIDNGFGAGFLAHRINHMGLDR